MTSRLLPGDLVLVTRASTKSAYCYPVNDSWLATFRSRPRSNEPHLGVVVFYADDDLHVTVLLGTCYLQAVEGIQPLIST